MKKGGGSNKGSAFERKLCKDFSLWASEGKRDDLFWRTAGSGARATCRQKKNITTANSCGDMGCLDAEYSWLTDKFVFEFKRGYNTWRLSDFLLLKECPLMKVWKKAEEEAKKDNNKSPLVILKQDRRQELMIGDASSLSIIIAQKYRSTVIKAINKSIWITEWNIQKMRNPVEVKEMLFLGKR